MGKKSNSRQKHRRFIKGLSEEEVLARLEIEGRPDTRTVVRTTIDPRTDPRSPLYIDPLYMTYLEARERQTKHRRSR